MNSQKNSLKSIMHASCSILVILNIALSVANLYQLRSYSLKSLHATMIAITSCLYLLFSLILLCTGILFPKNAKVLSGKIFARLFVVAFIGSLFQGKLLYARGKLSIRRRWDITLLIISAIFLSLTELFTALVVTDVGTLNIVPVFKAFVSCTYGVILTVQLISWLLLMIMGTIWQYIDTKERIQVPEDNKNLSHTVREKVQCKTCATVFQFDSYSGICPKCGTYNPLNQNTDYRDNAYKRNKSTLALIKPILYVILVILIGIIGALISQSR